MAELCRKNARLPVGCVIMASGLARRFGSNKLLANFGGRPLLCRALEVTATPALAARVVVTRSAEVKALCDAQAVPCLLHSLPGRNDTVRLGLEALLEQCPNLAGCIFLLQRETLEALITAFAQTQKETERAIFQLGARAAHGPDTVVGSPVLFGCGYFPALRTLPEGKGGSVVLKAHPEQVQIVYAQRREELLDADTPEALEELSAIAAQWCVT
uniref:nucleotidyltransferase family protein n=1 Tax=Faecalibacterium sp. TaxID=1971605 RepID=UPI003FF0CE91